MRNPVLLLIGAPKSRPSLFSPRNIWNRGVAASVSREKLLLRGPTGTRIAALTFDGGPHAEYTPAILKVLRYYGVRATFFVSGENARRFPDLVALIAGAGHVIGQGGYYPSTHPKQRSPKNEQELVEDLLMTEHWISKVTHEAPRLFRPAWRNPSMSQMRILWRRNQTIVLWNFDPHDIDCPSAAQLRMNFAQTPVRFGDVIRLHFAAPHTAAALDTLIPGAQRCGIEFGTPLDWLAGTPDPGTDIRAEQ